MGVAVVEKEGDDGEDEAAEEEGIGVGGEKGVTETEAEGKTTLPP